MKLYHQRHHLESICRWRNV